MSTAIFDQVASAHKWAPILVRTYSVLLPLSTLSIIIRVIAKMKTKAKFGLDDIFIFFGLAMCYTEAGLHLYAAHLGKQTVSMITEPTYSHFVKWVTISGMVYAPTVLSISVSVLFFYRRVFPIPEIKRLVTVFLALHVAWAIPMFFVQIFICHPVQFAWAPVMEQAVDPSKCINYPRFFLAILSLELGLNAAVLCLPIKQSLGLKLNLQTRLMLLFVFMLGGVSLISGIVRIQQTYKPGQPYIDFAGDMFWLAIHVNTALIAASLPIYRPLMRTSISFLSSSISKVYSSGSGSKFSSKGSSDGGSVPTNRVKESKSFSTINSEQLSQKSLVEKPSNEIDPVDRQYAAMDRQFAAMELQSARKGHISVERTFNVV